MGEKKDVWKETPRRGFATGDTLQPRASEGAVRDPGTVRHPGGCERPERTVRHPGGLGETREDCERLGGL